MSPGDDGGSDYPGDDGRSPGDDGGSDYPGDDGKSDYPGDDGGSPSDDGGSDYPGDHNINNYNDGNGSDDAVDKSDMVGDAGSYGDNDNVRHVMKEKLKMKGIVNKPIYHARKIPHLHACNFNLQAINLWQHNIPCLQLLESVVLTESQL